MAVARSGPYIWVTWLSKLLVGDNFCEWASWFKAHYRDFDRMPSDFDMIGWQMNHTDMLNEARAELEAEDLSVSVENQNYFRLEGGSGTVIGGKPDLVTLEADGYGTVYDVKTGQPKASDAAQVMIYMYALPLVADPKFRGREFSGCVVYSGGRRTEIPSDRIDSVFRERLYRLIRTVANADPPRRIPSAMECGVCDITLADCPDRVEPPQYEKTPGKSGKAWGADF